MPRISTDNYDTVASWNGSQDLFVVEQPDGTKVATPSQIKQYVLGNSIDDIYSVMGQMGAKNLNSYPYYDTTKTTNGITFTDNGDGTVTANGTATADAYFSCHSRVQGENNDLIIPNGNYLLSGCPSGGSYLTYCVMAQRNYNGASDLLGRDNGNGILFTANGDDFSENEVNLQIVIQIKSGQTVSNLTFKPMLRLASDTDETYQPYAMTNKQLTDGLDTAREQIAALENIKVANVSATMNVATADSKAIGGYRSVSSTSKALSTFTGYPTGKTVVATSLFAYGENAAILGVVHVINGVVYLNTAATGNYTVHGNVFYKD